ncbi:hypothetical protein E2C01_070003 [Portunus trituberculatus]|uniref:Uncharacterized protein n=1 Tax=Portunus trituberculatus TaxID=210409 RepID=A0A5B7HW13_PORTR|nr:hypothetical protein [Portunus trituberculatus]
MEVVHSAHNEEEGEGARIIGIAVHVLKISAFSLQARSKRHYHSRCSLAPTLASWRSADKTLRAQSGGVGRRHGRKRVAERER